MTEKVVLVKKESVAVDIVSLELVSVSQQPLPEFTAGSHIDIHVGDMVRQYSLYNSSDETHRYCLAILKDENGRGGSSYVHKQLSEGDEIEISTPRNLFPLNENAEYTKLFAGGIGITPILCMARRLHALGKPFEMHYCSRSQDRMAFYQELQNEEFADRIKYYFDDDERINLEKVLVGHEDGQHLYVCGPGGFMDAVINTALQTWPDEAVHREYFANAQGGEDAGEATSFDVKVASTGEVYNIPEDQSISTVLMEAGVDVMVSCEEGLCGTCLVYVLEGEPDHRDIILTEDERAANDQMTVCCSRSKSDLLVLDL